MTGEEAYELFAHDLMRFATGLVGPTDAPDLVSEAMLRCIYGKRWESVTDHRAYLHRAVLNEARNQYRSMLRRKAREYKAVSREQTHEPELQPEVLRAVSRLSLRQRAVIFLTYWSDLPPSAVSQMLGVTEGSVRRHLARARSRLRDLLNE